MYLHFLSASPNTVIPKVGDIERAGWPKNRLWENKEAKGGPDFRVEQIFEAHPRRKALSRKTCMFVFDDCLDPDTYALQIGIKAPRSRTLIRIKPLEGAVTHRGQLACLRHGTDSEAHQNAGHYWAWDQSWEPELGTEVLLIGPYEVIEIVWPAA